MSPGERKQLEAYGKFWKFVQTGAIYGQLYLLNEGTSVATDGHPVGVDFYADRIRDKVVLFVIQGVCRGPCFKRFSFQRKKERQPTISFVTTCLEKSGLNPNLIKMRSPIMTKEEEKIFSRLPKDSDVASKPNSAKE